MTAPQLPKSYGALESATDEVGDIASIEDHYEMDQSKLSKMKIAAAAVISLFVVLGIASTSLMTQPSDPEVKIFSSQKSSSDASNWFMYKYTMTGRHTENWGTVMSKYIVSSYELVDIGCNTTKANGNLYDIELHFVEGDLLEEMEVDHKTSYWQEKSTDIFNNMDSFHPFMHNKIQLLVSDLTDIDADSRSSGKSELPYMSTMRRLSTSPDGSSVAHLTMHVEGQLYEFVSPVTPTLNMDGYKPWAASDCPEAHQLSYNPVEMVSQLKEAGYEPLTTVGGFESSLWSSIHINTAMDSLPENDLLDDLQARAGLTVTEESYSSCTVTTVTGYYNYEPTLAPLSHYRSIKYVRNNQNSEALAMTAHWENAVDMSHEQLKYPISEHWGSNWDHWLDRHVGLQLYGESNDDESCTIADDNHNYFAEDKERRVGLRIDDGGTKFYVGYKGSMVWEYNIQATCGRTTWQQGVCGCTHANNLGWAEKEFGETGCPGVVV